MTGAPVVTSTRFGSEKLAVVLLIASGPLAVIVIGLAVTWQRPRD
jgi:hypothetical protein